MEGSPRVARRHLLRETKFALGDYPPWSVSQSFVDIKDRPLNYVRMMLRRVYEIVEQRLPNDRHQRYSSSYHGKSGISWDSIDQSLTGNEHQFFILKELGKSIDWEMAFYKYPSYEDRHHFYRIRCEEHSCDEFITSDTYRKWKNRQTRGPSLLCAVGARKCHLRCVSYLLHCF